MKGKLAKLSRGGYYTALPTNGYYGYTGYSPTASSEAKRNAWLLGAKTKNRDLYSGFLSAEDLAHNRGINNNIFAPTSGGLSINKYDGSVEVRPGFHMSVDTGYGGQSTVTNENRHSWQDVKNGKGGAVVKGMLSSMGLMGSLADAGISAADSSIRNKRGDSRFGSAAEENAAQSKWQAERDFFQLNKNLGDQLKKEDDQNGVGTVDYYAKYGGRLKRFDLGGVTTTGGLAIPLDEDGAVMHGDTHEEDSDKDGQTGITLTKDGEDVAEVEDKEVINKDGKAFSHRLETPNGDTIAEERIKIGMARNMLTEKLEAMKTKTNGAKNKYQKNHVMRDVEDIKGQLAKLDQREESLFAYQQSQNGQGEQVQTAKYGGKLRKFDEGGIFNTDGSNNSSAWMDSTNASVGTNNANPWAPSTEGGEGTYNSNSTDSNGINFDLSGMNKSKKKVDWGKVYNVGKGLVNTLAPYADNIYNAYAIEHMPKTPIPFRAQFHPLNVKADVSRQLTNVRDNLYTANKDTDRNTANSSAARNQKQLMYAKAMSLENDIIGSSVDKELAGHNKNIEGYTTMMNTNAGIANQYNTDVYNNEMSKVGLRSQNVSNAVQDFNQQIRDNKQYGLDKEKLNIMSRGYESSGSQYQGMGTPEFDSMINSSPSDKMTLWNKVKNDPTYRNKFIQLYGQP